MVQDRVVMSTGKNFYGELFTFLKSWLRPCYNGNKYNLPELLIDWLDLQVVQRQEGLGLNPLLLHVLYAVLGRLLRVTCYGVHVLSQHLGDGHLVFLVTRLTQVDQATKLEKGKSVSGLATNFNVYLLPIGTVPSKFCMCPEIFTVPHKTLPW